MGAERGSYRSIYSAIWDDPKFQALDTVAKMVFFALRTGPECNFPCLFVFYLALLEERLPDTPKERVNRGYRTLLDGGWIRYERPVMWIVKGLKNDPNYTPGNKNQVLGIESQLKSLPKLEIVNEFMRYYGVGSPPPANSDSPIRTPSEGDTLSPPKQGTGTGEGKGTGTGEGVMSGKPDDAPPYQGIIDRLNEKSGKSFKASSETTREHIHARWKEGATLADFIVVIDKKCRQWRGDPAMDKYLRPQTLFNREKFESYLNEKEIPNGARIAPGHHRSDHGEGEGKAGKYAHLSRVAESGRDSGESAAGSDGEQPPAAPPSEAGDNRIATG